MKPAAAIAAILLALSIPALADAGGRHRVRGYQRKDGTYVRPHWRGNPDGIASNNLSFGRISLGERTKTSGGVGVERGPRGEELAPGETYLLPREPRAIRERDIRSLAPGETAVIRGSISSSGYLGSDGIARDGRGRIKRSSSVRQRFLRSVGLTHTPSGCQVDHVIPLAKGGPDRTENMQLLCGQALRVKEATELR